MTKSARRSHHPKPPTATSSPTASGTGGFWRMAGNSESINGMPNGIFGVALALAVALVLYPLTRLVRSILRR
jgi:hypothetical protein